MFVQHCCSILGQSLAINSPLKAFILELVHITNVNNGQEMH